MGSHEEIELIAHLINYTKYNHKAYCLTLSNATMRTHRLTFFIKLQEF